MPAIVKVQVVAARDLPVMDRSSDSTDCFVEIRLAQTIHRTDVCKKTLNPEWDSQWYTYNVDDIELQDEPLTFKIMDYDQYSAHDAIGRVYISLDNVVFNESSSYSSLDGWFPIYDTLHGIRGEVHIKVMVEIIKDLHKHSSSEIMFFSGLVVPDGFSLEAIQGFLEELVVNDDPEYQWIDRIRPPRASNESRQQVFLKLSGELQRKIGMKALEAGGNAIIGYSQSFDLEGESGIVVRGIGTSVTLKPLSTQPPLTHSTSYQQATDRSVELGDASFGSSVVQMGTITPATPNVRPDSAKFLIPRLRHLSSSESDGGLPPSPVRPGGEFGVHLLGTSSGSGGGVVKSSTSEFNFYTLKSFPSGFIKTIAGIVAAHSVKLLDDINNPDEPETRDAWWLEIRQEIKSHSHSMNCDSVIGYSESTSICDGLCIFSATGTAVVTSHGLTMSNSESAIESPEGLHNDTSLVNVDQVLSPARDTSVLGADTSELLLVAEAESSLCSPCHISYSNSKRPYPVNLASCAVCKAKLVPSILLSSADIPPDLLVRGEGCLIQARVCRPKKRLKNEDSASSVSSDLPFLEYSLHGRLLNKLKLKGMNAIFGLDIVTTVGDNMIIGVATGTGVYLEALPCPGKIVFPVQESSTRVDGFQDIQSSLDKQQEQNRKRYKLNKSKIAISDVIADNVSDEGISPRPSSPNTIFDDPDIHGKDIKAFEIGEQKLKNEDVDDLMNDIPFHEDFHICNLSSVPGISEKKIAELSKVISLVSKQIFDSRSPLDQQLTALINKTLQKLLFRMRALSPCVITNISVQVGLPDDDEVQVTLVAVTSRIVTDAVISSPSHHYRKFKSTQHHPEELLFQLDDGGKGLEGPLEPKYLGDTTERDHMSQQNTETDSKEESRSFQMFITSPRPHVHKSFSSKYLSTINLFLIRETTSIKELGGMSSFLHTFISEAHALARAHVLSLGGNALVNYQLRQCVVMENHHKNQGQCLLNLAGDAAQIQELELCD